MISITTKENFVLSQIRYLQADYDGKVSYNILKTDLGMPERELWNILEELEDKQLISMENSVIHANTIDKELNVLDSKEDVLKEEYGTKEKKIISIIENLVNDSGMISKYILEGHLLYGDLKLNTLGTYNAILSLENKGIIKKVNQKDGEYYKVNLSNTRG